MYQQFMLHDLAVLQAQAGTTEIPPEFIQAQRRTRVLLLEALADRRSSDSLVYGARAPLRFLPKGDKQVVLGLITSKSGTLENKDDVKRRINEAAKFAPLEQFCLSPQCGFASTEEGNVLAEDEQWAKLSRILEVAKEVWG